MLKIHYFTYLLILILSISSLKHQKSFNYIYNPPWILRHFNQTFTENDSTFRLNEQISIQFQKEVLKKNVIKNLRVMIYRIPTLEDCGQLYYNLGRGGRISSIFQDIPDSELGKESNIEYQKIAHKPIYAIAIVLKCRDCKLYEQSVRTLIDRPMLLRIRN
jgi:hypothetical protein